MVAPPSNLPGVPNVPYSDDSTARFPLAKLSGGPATGICPSTVPGTVPVPADPLKAHENVRLPELAEPCPTTFTTLAPPVHETVSPVRAIVAPSAGGAVHATGAGRVTVVATVPMVPLLAPNV